MKPWAENSSTNSLVFVCFFKCFSWSETCSETTNDAMAARKKQADGETTGDLASDPQPIILASIFGAMSIARK